MKEIALGKETRRLQLRFEAQNVLNHMNAGNPVSGVTSSGFGTIITQFGNPRQAMVAAKLYSDPDRGTNSMKHALAAKFSRRSIIKAAAGIAAASQLGRAAEKGSAYGLIGDRYHNSDYIRVGLNRTIQKDLDVNIDFCDETKSLTAETLNGYKLLIILRDGMSWPDGYPDEGTNAGVG